jgi:hypothetical protein
MYVPRVLTAVLSKRILHVILIQEVTMRHFTLFTKGMFRLFSCSAYSGALCLLEK